MKAILTLIILLAFVSCSKRGSVMNTDDAITGLGESGRILPDGREYKYWVGFNDDDDRRVLVIHYYATKGKERLIMKDGVTYSTDDPLPDMKGGAQVVTSWPADSKLSGLVINGSKISLRDGLNVALVSNLEDPQYFVVKRRDVSGFMDAFKESDWDEFFSSRVIPELESWPQE